jgi:hypothetical protein
MKKTKSSGLQTAISSVYKKEKSKTLKVPGPYSHREEGFYFSYSQKPVPCVDISVGTITRFSSYQ